MNPGFGTGMAGFHVFQQPASYSQLPASGLVAAFALAFLATWLFLPPYITWLRSQGLLRANYRGQEVTWPGGLLLVPVTSLAFLIAAAGNPAGAFLSGAGQAALIATMAVMAGLGLGDDFFGGPEAKGLRGHLNLLLAGRVSTGVVKAGGGLLVALAFALVAVDGAVAVLVAALLVALMANAFNLLDLRPGRAVKAFLAGGAVLAALGPAGALALMPTLGAVVAYLPHDLHCRVMLGDTGANALGALLGGAAVLALSPAAQVILLGGLGLLHWYAEMVSLSDFIARQPVLRFLDELGQLTPAGAEQQDGRQG